MTTEKTTQTNQTMQSAHPLSTLKGMYSPDFERENCGFGMIVNLDNNPSHELVQTAITSLSRMTHRGGLAADGRSGDGCGLLLATPDAFFRLKAKQSNVTLESLYAVGVVFLDNDPQTAQRARAELNRQLNRKGLTDIMWQKVEVNPQILGQSAAASLPQIEYIYVNAPQGVYEDSFNRKLFVARRFAEQALSDCKDFYVTTLNSNTIAYKGLVTPSDLPHFYTDLGHKAFASSVCSYHQRFSTNTLPQWRLAQPFRYLAHNGELNTIQGNRNWANARRTKMASELLPELDQFNPLVSMSGSDSASLDNMLEILMMGGSDIFRSLSLLIPPAWQNTQTLDPSVRAFFEFHSMSMEPWDGPAALVVHNGKYAICNLDRNGLRPTRYVITKDRNVTFASEVGVFDYDPADVIDKGRVRAGQMIAVDLQAGKMLWPQDILRQVAQRPYQKWLDEYTIHLHHNPEKDAAYLNLSEEQCHQAQKYFQITFEERDQVIRVLAEEGQETTASMGDDTPLPVLSMRPRSVFDYFRQMFAQVTNPPIDSLREAIVMSLGTNIGRELSIFHEVQNHASRIELTTPVLAPELYIHLLDKANSYKSMQVVTLPLHYDASTSLEHALDALTKSAEQAVKEGNSILVLSDAGINDRQLTMHAAFATGAVHHRLIQKGLRTDANIIVSTATARDPHHYAVLIGYGATAVHPWLAYEVLRDMQNTQELDKNINIGEYIANYIKGINKGLLKILSKMGISTIASYRGSQLFESVGLSDEVINACFYGTVNRIGGTRFVDFHADSVQLHKLAFNKRRTIDQGGLFKYIHGGEDHAYNPDVVTHLRDAVQKGSQQDYDKFSRLVNQRRPLVLRDLLDVKPIGSPIDIEEVEPVDAILNRFDSAGISLGALSPEAHESLAIAMNRLGARSNSGEGGEDPARFNTEKVSKIKQIASGRFGVTPHYLSNAEVIQIKVAQGAKPGEGGQLPGHKVDAYIGMLRNANPGVTLISPPPHHDIYSIEDLAQLIFDLKQVNPDALISVKLVSAPGVGTVAAGVAKTYADLITIAGYDGGTGASPLTSVKYAGSPFELGLSEAHQVLCANDLRSVVRVQADGGLKTGLDVIKAALLGAESFGFGTAPMIALGCKYLRICHLNTCAVGVATQNERLRKEHFIGLPEMVMHYFRFVASETRQIMAQLGVRTMEELIGQTQYLKQKDGLSSKQQQLDLSPLLVKSSNSDKPCYCTVPKNNPWDKGELAQRMIAEMLPAIENKLGGNFEYTMRNTDRSIGARISGEIAKRWGNTGMSPNPINVHLKGVAGQSFGAWNAGGLNLYLEGDANDYVGKGMAGGQIVITPPAEGTFHRSYAPIIGNTCLYGATGGTLYAYGRAGERFAVRNSGATAVVEGVGDHGCEYMTGGTVVVLGNTGLNFGAGMSGGCAFVLDEKGVLAERYNAEMIDIARLDGDDYTNYIRLLHQQINIYHTLTQSQRAAPILQNFDSWISHFWLIKPKNLVLSQLWDMLQSKAA